MEVCLKYADGTYVEPRARPYERDCEWNRLIVAMPVREYCDWRLAGRPGFADMAPHTIRAWQKERAKVG